MAHIFNIQVQSYNLITLATHPPYFIAPYVQVVNPSDNFALTMFNLGGLIATLIVLIPYAFAVRHIHDDERYIYALGYIGVSFIGALNDLESVSQLVFGIGEFGVFFAIIPCSFIIYHVIRDVCRTDVCEIVLTENGKVKSK